MPETSSDMSRKPDPLKRKCGGPFPEILPTSLSRPPWCTPKLKSLGSQTNVVGSVLIIVRREQNMALIKCQECTKNFSSTLEGCPHCGIKVSKQERDALVILTDTKFPRKKRTALLLAIFLGSVSYIYTWRSNLGKFLVWFLCTYTFNLGAIIEGRDNRATELCLEVYTPEGCLDHQTTFSLTFVYLFILLLERVWVTIDVATKSESFYEDHPTRN
jgi:RNA polymerase subunit RPABC4/transcription elongation factor Spt4